MAEVRYADLKQNGNAQRVTTMGTQPSTLGLGDNWTQLEGMGTKNLLSGARQYAVLVSGRIGAPQVVGTGLRRARAEVMLGTTGGQRHPQHVMHVPLVETIPADTGIAFQFLLVITSMHPDQVFGSTYDLSVNELCLYARTFLDGDAQTYAVEFTVSDVTWLWFDLTSLNVSIGGDDARVFVWEGTQTLTATAVTDWQHIFPSSLTATSTEHWLIVATAQYRTRHWQQRAPHIFFGHNNGFGTTIDEIDVGNGTFGHNRGGLPPLTGSGSGFPNGITMQHGGFWVQTVASGDPKRIGMAAVQIGAPIVVSELLAARFLAVRLTPLPDLSFAHTNQAQIGVGATNPTWETIHQVMERPARGILTEPIVMVAGTPTFPNVRAAYGARLWNTIARSPVQNALKTEADALRWERAADWLFLRRQFQVLSPAMQWQFNWEGSGTAPALTQWVEDLTIVQFHPVRDPENATTSPGSEPSPLLLVPDKQAPDPANLQPPPFEPNSDPLEMPRIERQAIHGGTGYTRSWPMGARALRGFQLNWGPMSGADAEAVFDFLRANVAWRYTPPRGTALAVMNAIAPRMQQVTHRVFVVSVDVAVLRWTGV